MHFVKLGDVYTADICGTNKYAALNKCCLTTELKCWYILRKGNMRDGNTSKIKIKEGALTNGVAKNKHILTTLAM